MVEPFVEVISEQVLAERIQTLGESISADYSHTVPVLVGVLAGSIPFLSDLSRNIAGDCEIDFLSLNRFGEGGRARISMDTETSLEHRDVLIVEDIVDTGLSLTFLRRLLSTRDLASLRTVALLDKAPRRIVEVPVEYRGFEVGDEFLLGYGLDWEGHYRNLRSIWAVLDLATFRNEPERLGGYAFGR
ncbi:MAG TPA: hypoxanthine phosphoribosyltransferase [Acidimicrobiia bacterium]|nr:hypoxanthine phosphoribosyltransferase [Acidimicrobiia bacterium]